LAMMFPEKLPSKASAGEDRIFAILKNLPDDCTVYYEPEYRRKGQTQRPDFIVVMPDVGVLVIEVKGWYARDIQSANSTSVVTKIRDHVETHRHPLKQASDYMFALFDRTREFAATHPEAQRLFHTQGERTGKFLFPFASLAYLHNITRNALATTAVGDIEAIFGPPGTMVKDECSRLETSDPTELLHRLKDCFKPWWPFGKLDDGQVQTLRAIIYPELRINAKNLTTLDNRQAQHAMSIGSGHRVIYGVAGSGKTVILTAKARLDALDREKRILVLCYNKALASQFRTRFRDLNNVTARHFHDWGRSHGVQFVEDKDAYGEHLLERLENAPGDGGAYDAVLIDEGQDFAKSWLQCAKAALKEPDDGTLIVVGDGSQSLYKRRPFTWKEAGIRAQGRAISKEFDLDINYRNTRQILSCAVAFSRPPEREGDDFSSKAILVRVEDASREGVPPRLLVGRDRDHECGLVVTEIRQWLEHGLPTIDGASQPIKPHEIGILYARRTPMVAAAMDRLIANLQTMGPVMWWNRPGGGDFLEPGIRVQTIHSARGLQYKAVVVLWSDLLPMKRDDPDQTELDRRLLYVALTRAEDVLLVTRSAGSLFTNQLEQTIDQGLNAAT